MTTAQTREAKQFWQQGEVALEQGKPDEAIACYQRSLLLDPQQVENHLCLAVAYLEKEDETAACPHLAEYLATHPEQYRVRVRYAELLLRGQQVPEARAEFERCIADAQQPLLMCKMVILQCHSRLMEIAEEQSDAYAEHLHRGIGLFLLAEVRPAFPVLDEATTEELLRRSAAELAVAQKTRPDEARPCWYLHQVWSDLGQRQPAMHWLRLTEASAPFSYLTPKEKLDLQLACRNEEVISH